MRVSAAIAGLALAATVIGCGRSEAPPVNTDSTPYTSLPSPKTPVSGLVYDPDAFFFALATFPTDPDDPSGGPPPALFEGIPFVTRSAAMGTRVSLTQNGTVVDTSGPSTPDGFWQAAGIPTGDATYFMRAEPPAEPLTLGAPEIFPSPPFVPVPEAKYYPTTTLRPIVPLAPTCYVQVAAVLGDAGALTAVANLLTDMGTPTTAADLANPDKTGSVVFIWVATPSPVFESFIGPAGGIQASASAGNLYSIIWAPPNEGPPGQSPMGYFAVPDNVGPLGYFALILPPGTTGPVKVSFTDTNPPPDPNQPQDPNGPPPNPWVVPDLEVMPSPGISFARLFATGAGAPEEPPPGIEQPPPTDFTWLCMPQGGP